MTPLFGWFLGAQEMIILLVLGVLLFGRRLPEIGRYLGKGIVEFKKGLHGLEDELDITGRPASPQIQQHQQTVPDQVRAPQRVAATAPKFDDNLPDVPTPPRS